MAAFIAEKLPVRLQFSVLLFLGAGGTIK
jgi:hypothetical protein